MDLNPKKEARAAVVGREDTHLRATVPQGPRKIDVKATDPVRDPAASTTNEDLARAEGEGMTAAETPKSPKKRGGL